MKPETRMLERELEAKVRQYAKNRNIVFWKFVSPGNRGVPDRLLIGPNGRMGFLELKRRGQLPTRFQAKVLSDLSKRGVFAGYTDSFDGAKQFLDNFLGYDALCK